jgi:hypothetical protein
MIWGESPFESVQGPEHTVVAALSVEECEVLVTESDRSQPDGLGSEQPIIAPEILESSGPTKREEKRRSFQRSGGRGHL